MPILTSEERIGTLLAEKYRIDRIIGKGGMGVVFAAEHTWTGRQVAVKIIHPTLAEDEILAQRLLREARTAASLNHPNAVQVLDMGEDADGTVFLVLELLEGESLSQRLRRPPVLTFPETLAILLPVMNALALAHEQGLVHRDLKPDNIFLHNGATGVVPTLLDFGIAKVLQDGDSKVTQTGVIMGTPHYIAPEQAVGESTVGPPADVWAMGVLLFECLMGRMPFEGDSSTKIVMKVISEPAPKLADLGVEPTAAARAIDRALESDLSLRYANMREFAEALWAAATQAGYATVPVVAPAAASGANAAIPAPASGSGHVPLHTPADGSAPALTFEPSLALKGTEQMGAVPPLAKQTSHAPKPWGAIALAIFLVGAASVAAGVVVFGSDDTPSDAVVPVPTTSAPSATTEPTAPPQAEPDPVVAEEAPEPAPIDVEPAPTEASPEDVEEVEPASEPEPEGAARRRRRRGADPDQRPSRPEISSSW